MPVATALSLGGVKADPKTEGDTVPVHIDSNGFLFVPTYTGGGGSEVFSPVLINLDELELESGVDIEIESSLGENIYSRVLNKKYNEIIFRSGTTPFFADVICIGCLEFETTGVAVTLYFTFQSNSITIDLLKDEENYWYLKLNNE